MAETVIDTTVQIMVEKLIGIATQELSLILGFKAELKRLKKSLEMTWAFLHDASKRQLEHELAVKLWLKNLEDVAYDADNLLDEFNYEIIRRKVDDEDQMKPKKVCFFFTCNSNPLAFRSRMAHKIKHVNMKLKMANEEASSHGLQNKLAGSKISIPLVMETNSRSVGPLVVGRENDVSNIVDVFFESINEVISVIPIVGMGGLGKTTLAQLIFKDERTLKQFDERIWVCVSENFDITMLFKRILESLTKVTVTLESKEAIVNDLHEKLGGKRYLLVLDDLWNDNRKLWDDFKRSLSGVNNKIGNFILVTTRKKDMASIVNSESNYVLGSLGDNDCWSIIKARTFPNREVPKEFETIGSKIASKCKGLPLAANMIGGTLRGKGLGDWTSILESGFSNANSEENEVLQVLKVSFDRLPSLLLKKCFAYCSVFKKDERLERDRLVQLWMAEGFLIENSEMDMERVGDSVFDALLHSFFFLEIEEESFLGIKYYKMHDLVHDLACLVSQTESFNAENHVPDRIPRVRYLAMKSLHEGVQKIMKDEALNLRTLFVSDNVPDNMYQDLKHLRVLDMRESKLEVVTDSIDKLIHLRLLDVSSTNIKSLPESICKLYHLQTLNIIDCFYLKELPNQFHHLVSLRHLISKGAIKMPLEIGKLTCLQTLTFFHVGCEKGLQIQELQYLTNLKGLIFISHLELVNGKDEAAKAKLIEKPNIQELGLVWNVQLEGEEDNHEKVLEGLQPHRNLKRLYINGFNGDKFSSWIMKMTTLGEVKLNNLIKISLSECRRCQEIPTLGHLPLLERLYLERLANLKSIGPSFYYSNDSCQSSTGTTTLFPALKSFQMFKLKKLVDWVGPAVADQCLASTSSFCSFPKLEELDITECWCMIIAPSNDFPSLQNLRISSMNSFHVLERLSSNKLTSLVRLSISGILDLGCINEMAFRNKPCLEYLQVEFCGNLNHLGLSDDAHNLKSLTIWMCDNLSSISYSTTQSQGLSCLKILRIEYCSLLSIFPITEMLQSCTSLEDLSISECHNLTSLPIDFTRMPHLSNVTISKLPKLTTSPRGFGSLTMLTMLQIGSFSEESGFSLLSEIVKDILGLKNLRNLLVFGWQQWESLPDQLQNLTTLRSLEIEGFGIEALPDWIWNMCSLEFIRVAYCEKLRYNPSEESIRRLPILNLLSIRDCPLIETVQWTKWSSFS